MRKFTQKGPRIDQLSLEAKLIYTVFCLMSLAALAVSALYYVALVGGDATTGVKQYYAGDVSDPQLAPPSPDTRPTPSNSAGPALDLPDEEEPVAAESHRAKLVVQVSQRKLLEVTHFHLFTVPVFLLIICHLFMLCGMRRWLKLGMIATGLGSTVLHLIAPWLVYWGGGAWAWTMPLSGGLMGTSLTVMTAWPCITMWRTRPAKKKSSTQAR